jgi:hypothetical protein
MPAETIVHSANLFLEMPPGHTLSDLAEENLPSRSQWFLTARCSATAAL